MTEKKSLNDKIFPLLFDHDVNRIIGTVTFSEPNIESFLLNDNYQFDMGFQVLKEKTIDGVRHIEKIKIYEISICPK